MRLLGDNSSSISGYICIMGRVVELRFESSILFFTLKFCKLLLIGDQLALQSKGITVLIEFVNPFHIKQLSEFIAADGLGQTGESSIASLASLASLTNDD